MLGVMILVMVASAYVLIEHRRGEPTINTRVDDRDRLYLSQLTLTELRIYGHTLQHGFADRKRGWVRIG